MRFPFSRKRIFRFRNSSGKPIEVYKRVLVGTNPNIIGLNLLHYNLGTRSDCMENA